MQAYPEYKETGFEWLGEIPAHWGIGKLGGCFEERNEKVSDEDFAPLSVTKNGIVPQMKHVAKTDAGDNRKKVCVNDFVINSRSDRKGSSGTSQYEGSVSLISTVLKPREYIPEFAHHLLRSYNFQEEFYRYGKGIVADLWSTRYAEMKSITVPLIPEGEQKAIASYLDRETARIDNLIAEKQNFINLLKEKRQALISHMVTKGLDPDVKMKDSGIEWIGEVPEHWFVGSLGYYASLNTGATPDRKVEDYWGGDIPWIKTGEVRYNTIYDTEEKITEEGLKNSSTKLSPPGTVLMAMYGQGVTRGRVAILGVSATYNQACVAISPNKKVVNVFLKYVLMAAYNYIRNVGNETSQMNLNADLVSKIKIVVPPIEEQNKINEYIEERTSRLEALEAETESSIGLLREHRTALISAAVTGKIDVRAQV